MIAALRPADLPEFRKPPLNEVVVGVQFAQPRGYSQIHAGEVWGLFKSDYPLVAEHPALAPSFEVFGRLETPQMPFGIITGASHDRFWFLSPHQEELIQFQHDRLMHNWRKVGDQTNEYPRFEKMIEKFEHELQKLEAYLATLAKQTLTISQCEVTYVNHFPCEGEGSCAADKWIKFLEFETDQPDDLNLTIRRTIHGPENRPIGRLIIEAATALTQAERRRVIRYSLTTRGIPSQPDIPAALEFLKLGREIVVKAFTDTTTESAHSIWERTQ